LGEKEGFLPGMETTILLTTINRIGGLMQVGFGEAGASMIAKNLADSSGGQLNFMGGGTMIKSIFGFCDVRQFTDTTECLQEEVMLFVNRIAFILHDIVVQCSGAANKNIGDAFLLAWKLDDKMPEREVTALADQALLAFCKTLVELARYQKFICNFSPAATERLAKRFPDYQVRIGSGLHVGWAIEGAIGSNRKIDASYLSPHVNFTEFLESSTKEYGVPLLFSEPFYNLLSPPVKKYCRQVDRIRRSMGEDPVGLFVYDFDMTIDWNDGVRLMRRAALEIPGESGRTGLVNRNDARRVSDAARTANDAARRSSNARRLSDSRKATGDQIVRERRASNGLLHTQRHTSRLHLDGLTPTSRHSQLHLQLDGVGQTLRHPSRLQVAQRDKPKPATGASPWHVVDVEAQDVFYEDDDRMSHPPIRGSGSGSGKHSSVRSVRHNQSTRSGVGGSTIRQGAHSGQPLRTGSGSTSRKISVTPEAAAILSRMQSLRATTGKLVEQISHLVHASRDNSSKVASLEESNIPKIALPSEYTTDIWDVDLDLVECRHLITESFRQQWDKGIQAYIKGDWQKARDIFHETATLSNGDEDGPSSFLINVIDHHGGTKPANWAGYRMEQGGEY
jgi:class 3 adenylate cyclase